METKELLELILAAHVRDIAKQIRADKGTAEGADLREFRRQHPETEYVEEAMSILEDFKKAITRSSIRQASQADALPALSPQPSTD